LNSIPSNQIRDFLYTILRQEEVEEFSAAAVSDGLVHASLRGVDSHGIRLFPHYLASLKGGRINGQPQFSFSRTSSSTGILDADDAFGHAAGLRAVKEVVELSNKAGMGSVSVKRSTHFGAASFFGLEIAKHNMLGFSFTHSDPLIPPTGGKKPFLGNNPICFTAPCQGEDPICLDMATSMITFNKVLRMREDKEMAPTGVGFDKNGIEAMDPNKIVSLAPVGGYKGYGLSLMVEILCAVLSGMPFAPSIGHMYNDSLDKKRNLGQFFMAIKIESFLDLKHFKERIKELADDLRNQEPADSKKELLVAGDPEKIMEEKRRKNGIPVGKVENDFFNELSVEYGIQL
jgi:ureidoglycolate dehydrogenase (NAD+)